MSDDAERFYELRDEVERESKMYAAAAQGTFPDSFTDETGTITARVDERGLLSCDITDRWRDGIEASALGDRIVATFQSLNAVRVEAWAANIGEASEQDQRPSPTSSIDDSVAGKLQAALQEQPESGPAVEKVLENVLSMLDEISANLDETFSGALNRGRQTEKVAPLSQNLTVELAVGGQLAAVSISPSWAERTSGAQISRELNESLREVFEKTAPTREAGPLEGTPLEKYGRLIDDPDAFVAFISGKE